MTTRSATRGYIVFEDLLKILDDEDDCDAAKIIQLYMAKNMESGEWGYAAEGFRTTDGDYLEVIT